MEQGSDDASIEIIYRETRRQVQIRATTERGIRRRLETNTKTKSFGGTMRNIRDNTIEPKAW
jgi:hypothetical protein